MNVEIVELGIPYTGWPVRAKGNYEFGLSLSQFGADRPDL